LSRFSEVEEEYVSCAGEDSLLPLEQVDKPARLLVAVKVGGVRLIDNVSLERSASSHNVGKS
jgi:pantoate--beta-alanine ligase